MTTLNELVAAIPAGQIVATCGDLSTDIKAPVVESSQDVRPGGVFVARAGQTTDGHRFISGAIAAGAAAVIGEAELTDLPVPYIRVKMRSRSSGSWRPHTKTIRHESSSSSA